MITDYLTRVIDAIKADPHGDTARNYCQVLRKCHAEGTLTDEILKGF